MNSSDRIMNSSDRIMNNLNVLQKHGMLLEENSNLYDCSTKYTFNTSDYQLSQLNITEANDIYMHGHKPGDVFVSKRNKYIDKVLEDYRKINDKTVKEYCDEIGMFTDSACRCRCAPTKYTDYKNKPHLRSNYMSDYDITKVEVLNDRVVIMRFGDGSFTKAICTEDDAKNGKFDIDIGITICFIKKIIGEADGKKKAYAKLIRDIHKMMDEQDKLAKEEEQRKANAKARKLRKAQRRAAAVKQENDMFRNDISDAVLYALERLDERKTESEKVE